MTAFLGVAEAPKAVVFDWDNTLVDSWRVIFDSLNATFEKYGLDVWSFDKFKQTLGPSIRDSFPGLFGDRWQEAGDYFYATFETRHLSELVTLPGARRAVEWLAGAGIPMAVVSNKTGRYLRAEIDHLGWDGYFPSVVGALDAPRDKPHPEPVIAALRPFGLAAAADVWLVGDSRTDLETAHNAGCRAILVRGEPPAGDEFAACPPDAHFADLDGFCDYLLELPVPNRGK